MRRECLLTTTRKCVALFAYSNKMNTRTKIAFGILHLLMTHSSPFHPESVCSCCPYHLCGNFPSAATKHQWGTRSSEWARSRGGSDNIPGFRVWRQTFVYMYFEKFSYFYSVQFNGDHAASCITAAQMLFFVMLPGLFKREREEGNLCSLEMNMWSPLVTKSVKSLLQLKLAHLWKADLPSRALQIEKECCVFWSCCTCCQVAWNQTSLKYLHLLFGIIEP